MANKRPDFQLSSDSLALSRLLATVPIGGKVSYSSITAELGRPFTACRSALSTARRCVMRDKRMVFGVIRDEGLIRLDDSGIVDLSDKARDQARRHARNIAKKLTCVDYDSLPKDKQTKHNAALSMFGIISEISTLPSQHRLEAKVMAAGTHLAAAKAAIESLDIKVGA